MRESKQACTDEPTTLVGMQNFNTDRMPISVVVPAFNEQANIATQLEEIRSILNLNRIEHEIIVVDDGSQDKTAEMAFDRCDNLVRHPENLGYGAALKAGIIASKFDTIIIIDADGTYPSDVIPILLDKARFYDMVVGARILNQSHIPFIRKPAKWFLQNLASYLAGRHIPDLNSGLRVMKKSVLERFFNILPSGFSFTLTITLSMLCNDYQVYYHPIEYYRRIGKSKLKAVESYNFLLLVLRTIVFFNPLKVFIPLGAIFFLLGFSKLVYDLFSFNVSESAVMGLLGSFMIWTLGIISDQISRIEMGTGIKRRK